MPLKRFAPIVVILSLVALISIPSLPVFHPVPLFDSGVYLYVGSQILHGKVPYLDVWDHKPPVVYYIDALGLFVGQGSQVGVWFIELALFICAAILCYTLLKRAFNSYSAFLGTCAFLIGFYGLSGWGINVAGLGNAVLEYTFPFSFGLIFLFFMCREYSRAEGILVGILSAGIFLLKFNAISVPIVIIGLLLFYNGIKPLKDITIGFVAITGITAAYFYATGAFFDMIDAVFRYNYYYTTISMSDRVMTLMDQINMLPGLLVLVLVAWVFCIYRLSRSVRNSSTPLLLFAALNLPVEYFFIVWWRTTTPPLTLLPAFTILIAFLAFEASSVDIDVATDKLMKVAFVVLLLFACIVPILSYAIDVNKIMNPVKLVNASKFDDATPTDMVVSYIENTTNRDDYVLVWGSQTTINFLTHRDSPTPFVHQWPLYTHGYTSPELIEKFENDMIKNKPVIIIDMSSISADQMIPPLNYTMRKYWIPPPMYIPVGIAGGISSYEFNPSMDVILQYIDTNYQYVGSVGVYPQWEIYRLKSRL